MTLRNTKMHTIKLSIIVGIDPSTYVEQDFFATYKSEFKRCIPSQNIIRWRNVKNPGGTTYPKGKKWTEKLWTVSNAEVIDRLTGKDLKLGWNGKERSIELADRLYQRVAAQYQALTAIAEAMLEGSQQPTGSSFSWVQVVGETEF
ncbi:Uncharacterized protein Fot_30040 [Forsythia ovata]|uniref:Uncharacterized protein n=1 Tax=Forsythia ovata TaxID=205694 RepID=A0ABD1TTL3_9LAMI